jgi:hypothetical protein
MATQILMEFSLVNKEKNPKVIIPISMECTTYPKDRAEPILFREYFEEVNQDKRFGKRCLESYCGTNYSSVCMVSGTVEMFIDICFET